MIKELIYNYYQKEIAKEHKAKDMTDITFSPSSLSDCRRKLFYKWLNYEQSDPIEPASMVKMDMGSTVHSNIEKILKEQNIYLEGEELKTIEYQGLKFRYMIDGKVVLNDTQYIFELKTVYASGYSTIEKEPKSDHLMQLTAYMLFEKVNQGILLYIGRDNGFMVEYEITIDNNNIIRIRKDGIVIKTDMIENFDYRIKELTVLKRQIETGTEPDRDYQIVLKNNGNEITDYFTKDKVKYKSDWHCLYCSYRRLCWDDVISAMISHRFYIDGKFID